MSLDFYLTRVQETDVFDANITHNLGAMADKAGIYYALWRPEEKGYEIASDILPVLKEGLEKLRNRPDYYKGLNPENGWGDYDGFVSFVERVIDGCEEYPDAKIRCSR